MDAVMKAAEAVGRQEPRARLWHRSDRLRVVRVVLDAVGYDALGEQHGPRPACPECGMGGDVGADTPNPIPF